MEDRITPYVKNLGHAAESMRLRAIRTILAKLDYELVTLDELLGQPNLVPHLINWLKSRNSVGTEEVLELLHRLVKKKEGVKLLLRYDPSLSELSKAVGPQGGEFVNSLLKFCDRENVESRRPQRKMVEFENLEPVRDGDSSVKSSLKSDSSSISPKNGITKRKKKKKKCCFHERVVSSDLSASSLPWDSSKSYKSTDPSSEVSSDVINNQLNRLDDLNHHTPKFTERIEAPSLSSSPEDSSLSNEKWPQICWPSPSLAESDLKVLKTVSHSLRDRDQCREAVNFLSTVVLEDFPPQMFLNDTSILQSLLRLAEDNTHHQDVVVKCLSELTYSLVRFYHFYNDCNSFPHSPITLDSDRFDLAQNVNLEAKTDGTENNVSIGISLGDYCGFVLEKVGPGIPGILRLLKYCIPDAVKFWKLNDDRCLVLKQGIMGAFSRFGDDLIKERAISPLQRLQAHIGIFQLLRCVIPESSAVSVICRKHQMAIYHTLLDPVLQILYPSVLKVFRSYVESFDIKNGIPYKDYFELIDSLDAGATFIKTAEWSSLDELLDCFSTAIPGLEFHQQYDMISKFVDFIMHRKIVSKSQIHNVQSICLKLFSSPDGNIRRAMYESAARAVATFLSPHKSSKDNVPFPELHFVINKKTLWEIISYGLTSKDSKIRESSESIMVLVLKCQFLVTVTAWRDIIHIVGDVFPLLHSMANMNNNFGRAVISTLDPDVAKEMKVSELEVLKGNVRLMMSKDLRAKEEGTARVIYLVDIQSHVGRHESFNLSLDPEDGFTKAPAKYEEGSLLRVLQVMKMGSDDFTMLKSAITQLSLMSEDSSLHIPFLDHQGLELVVGFLKSSVELPNSDSQHFFMHSVVTLKHISESCMQVRLELSHDLYFLTILLKGIFLYGDDWRILRDASQLLALIVYAEVIVSKDGELRFPYAVIRKVKLPYRTKPYGESSENAHPSRKGKILGTPSVQKSLGLRWCAASVSGGVDELVQRGGSLKELTIPPLLPVMAHDLSALTECSILHNMKLHLDNLSTAYSHSTAEDAVDSLTCYLRIAVAVGECDHLFDLQWEKSFKRYLTTLPASGMDQVLLSRILRFLNELLVVVPNQLPWVSKIVKDPAFGFNSLLSQLLVADMDTTAKDLSLEILTLVGICLKEEGNEDEWDFVVSCLVQCLSQSHTQQFYSIAIMNKLLKCLLGVTEKKIYIKTKSFWKLLNAFHCPTPNSCMGLTITRLTLLCLCNLLPLHPRTSEIVKSATEIKWLWEMLCSSDVVVKSASLELLCSLCYDSSTTEQILSQSSTLWNSSLQILLDHNESNFAREQAARLCNVIVTNSANKMYVKDCVDAELFKCVAVVASRVDFPAGPPSLWFPPEISANSKPDSLRGQQSMNNMTTPTLLASCCDFCLSLLSKDRDQILCALHSQGLASQLFRQVSQWQSARALCNPEKVAMYASICRLLVHCASSSTCPILECIPVMVWLLQDSSYCENVEKTDLISQSITLLSSIVIHQPDAKVLFTKEAVDTICNAIGSSNEELCASFTVALPPLTSFLSAEASVSIVKGLGKYKPSHRMLLSGILASSNAGTLAALECDMLAPVIHNLREININLAIVPLDIPRSKKANATLNSLSIDFGLITNFLAGSIEAKEQSASLGLADAVHKLWAWCLLDQDLLCSLLQVLVTFTADCSSAAASLVLTSNMIGVGQRKTPSSNSLLHASISLLSKDTYSSEVKSRILELAAHACQALESRTVLVKSIIIPEFLKFGRLKRCQAVDELEVPWLQFLVVFTYYNEGQSLIKNEEFFSQLMMYLTTGRQCVKPIVVSIFRNLTFNQNNKQKLIVSDNWLKCIANRALEATGNGDELEDLALIVWYLAANSQRGKYAVRSVSLDTRLQMAVASLPDDHPTLEIVQEVMSILKPPSRDS